MNEKSDWVHAMSPLSDPIYGKLHYSKVYCLSRGNFKRQCQRWQHSRRDSATEARDRHMSVEVSAASMSMTVLLHISTVLAVEFAQETYNALMGVDVAVVVCEPNSDRVLTPLFKFRRLGDSHLVFINKMDHNNFMDVLHALKSVSSRPLVPHQYPIGQGEEPDLLTCE